MNFHTVGERRFYPVVNLVVCEDRMATELERGESRNKNTGSRWVSLA